VSLHSYPQRQKPHSDSSVACMNRPPAPGNIVLFVKSKPKACYIP
jgi:hypothetical protein